MTVRTFLRTVSLVGMAVSSVTAGDLSSEKATIPKRLVGDWLATNKSGNLLHIEADGTSLILLDPERSIELLHAQASARYDSVTHIFHFNGSRFHVNEKALWMASVRSSLPERYKKCEKLQLPQESYDRLKSK